MEARIAAPTSPRHPGLALPGVESAGRTVLGGAWCFQLLFRGLGSGVLWEGTQCCPPSGEMTSVSEEPFARYLSCHHQL